MYIWGLTSPTKIPRKLLKIKDKLGWSHLTPVTTLISTLILNKSFILLYLVGVVVLLVKPTSATNEQKAKVY